MVTMLGWFSAEAARASLHEAATPLGVAGRRRGEHLDRDAPPEARVDRAVDDAHAATADFPLDPVVGEHQGWPIIPCWQARRAR